MSAAEELPTPSTLVERGGKMMPAGRPFTAENRPKGGRPPGIAKRIREMVGDDPARVANVLFEILENPREKSSDRIAAAREIFDRGWGKAPSFQPIEGGDPLEGSELDKAIRDVVDQLVARRAHPELEPEVIRDDG